MSARAKAVRPLLSNRVHPGCGGTLDVEQEMAHCRECHAVYELLYSRELGIGDPFAYLGGGHAGPGIERDDTLSLIGGGGTLLERWARRTATEMR